MTNSTPQKSRTAFTMLDLIRGEMALQGVTQRELARRVNISFKHMNLVINGKTGVSFMLIDQMMGALRREFVVTTRGKRG